MTTSKIGIPRGMLYFDYYPIWEEYFRKLGLEVVTSPKTNRDILNSGISKCVDEACLPVKLFHGHVEYLKDKVDYLFIPRIMSIHKKEYCCPKHLGLPDMVKNSIEDLPTILNPTINLNNSRSLRNTFLDLGKTFTKNHYTIARAYYDANKSQNQHNDLLLEKLEYQQSEQSDKKINILLLGHSYNIYDEFLNMEILQKLKNRGVNIYLSDYVSEDDYRKYSSQYTKRIFWTHGRKIVGSASYLIDRELIDGVIYLSAFGCGLDSVLIHLVTKIASEKDIPIMQLTLDEQTGEAGLITRYEAFLDMMNWRLKDENNISAFR